MSETSAAWEMDCGEVVTAGGKLATISNTLHTATTVAPLAGAEEYPLITGAVTEFHTDWDQTISQTVSSIHNLGSITGSIGNAVAQDDTHRANIFRIGIDRDWKLSGPPGLHCVGPQPKPVPPAPSPVPPAPVPVAPVHYAPQEGENLTWLSERYNVPITDIVTANQIEDPNLIVEGQELVIPQPNGPLPDPRMYTPQAGENLSWISERYGVPVDQIVAANHIADPNTIDENTQLVIPAPPGAVTEKMHPAPPKAK